MGEVEDVARQLARAVELTMDPAVPQSQRMEAYTACEQFKEKSPFCVQCGLYLAQRADYSHFVRHFGLQLMEHCVKYRWYNMTQPEKLFIKENAMKLVEGGMEVLIVEHAHIKDAMSRVVVEMIKREWPQQWPTLLTELSHACTKGCTQTELVLLVFLRLVEDVAILQTLESQQRRKDIYHALTTNMGDIFSFFLRLIEEHYEKSKNYLEKGFTAESATHTRVVQVVLLTLSGFVEWVAMSHIMADDGRLLQILCLLLNNDNFQTGAAECLFQIVSRKGKVDEKRPLMTVFNALPVICIFQATNVSLNEKHYFFLKKLTQVLTGLGMQLCTIWSKDENIFNNAREQVFGNFLEALVTFSRHPSLRVAHYANTLWSAFLKHEQISKDPVFLNYIPKWVEATAPKTMKVVFPLTRSAISPTDAAAYALLDCDSEEEFSAFFHRCRTDMLESFRQATLIAPLLTFTYMQEWLTVRIQNTLAEGTIEPFCTMQSPAYIEWEALSQVMVEVFRAFRLMFHDEPRYHKKGRFSFQVLDSVLSRIVMCTERPSIASGLHLLDLCLALDPKDPLILSTLLSCISALFVFLSMSPADTTTVYLPRVLEKIFAALVFTLPGETKESRSRAVKNVRRHAASLMVKIGQKYPLILLPVFDWIHAIVNNLENKLSKLESICLQEALLLISNHFCEYERESAFVREILRPVATQWLTMTNQGFGNPLQFMAFVGLDKPPVEPSSNDTNGKNRSQIMCCVDLLTAVVKRCAWPDDPDRAMRGGFVIGRTDAGHPIYRNPATPHLLPLFPGLLSLMKVFNALWTPEALAALSEGYKNAHGLCEADINNLFRINSVADPLDLNRPSHTPLHRMQQFLTNVHDNCYHILGHAFPSLGRDLHELPHLADSLILTILSNIDHIPDYRLRPMVRIFFKGFVVSCPADCYDSVVVPVLAHFTPCMLSRLSAKWQHIAEQKENGNVDEENTDTQEMLEDMLNRILLREYLEVIKLALFGGSSIELNNTMCSMEEDSQDTRTNTSEVISELGLRLLHCDPSCQAITLTLLSALYWGDSTGSMKAYSLVTPVIRQLVQDNRMTAQLAVHTMTCVLQGLQQHGQHDANQGSLLMLGAQLYDMLRPTYPELLDLLKKIPEVNLLDLQKLDERVLKEAQKGKVEKAKRDMFKKITTPLHGCNMSQLFRRKVFIRDLPRIDMPKHIKNPNLLDNTSVHENSSLIAMFKTS